MKSLKTLALAACLLAVSLLEAQSIHPDLQKILEKTLDSMRTKIGNKSLSAAIQFKNDSIWAYATGISAAPAVKAKPNQAYLIGSVTKTITAACILQMVDEGKIALDDPLSKYLDSIKFVTPTATIRQLLRHQSGIYDALENPAHQQFLLADPSKVWNPRDFIEQFIKSPNFQPGGGWRYCNTGYFLLGMIIEKVSGQPFHQELRDRFFDPMGLKSVFIPAFEPISVPVCHAWMDLTGDGVNDDAHNFYMNYKSLNSVAGAAGGYFSTASDLSKWMKKLMRGDLLSPAMMTAGKQTVTAPGLPISGYGLSFNKKTFVGLEGWGHGGDLVYSASSWYFPMKDVSISVLNNENQFTSWQLAPVVAALLKNCIDWEKSLPTVEFEGEKMSVSVFPNPFSSELNLKIESPVAAQNVEVKLTNSLGTTVNLIQNQALKIGDNSFSFNDLGELPAGVYFVSMIADGRFLSVQKLLKL